ncbi:MAG: Polyribonucleotide nucleotidyltransferase [Chlamydiales bacterium]|nr:Polyribonucleotide nucleotidyltransferase [Chlamydiales bacterium]MCH9620408.1 Polyribonucleotide nucleotidyltransferase [Chlamydiales bacterium]MCH9622946.1 Polyribonucleotide nucleotidyltransferase [Chlamydiales bacterium]
MKRKFKSVKISEDKELTFETGKIAKQAGGSVLVKMGETVVFASACAAKEASEEIDFFPLRVDYQEKFSSTGKTLGGFIKREGRPAEKEILTCRLIDRPIRPMFEDGYFNEVQVLSYVWSYDGENQPDPLALCAVSAALSISEIPFVKPIAGVRVGMIDSKFVINPTAAEMEKSTLDLLLAGSEDAILMIEGYCDFLTEEQVVAAIAFGHETIKLICAAIGEWQAEIGKPKERGSLRVIPEELTAEIEKLIGKKLTQAIRVTDKQEREKEMSSLSEEVMTHFFPEGEDPRFTKVNVKTAYKKVTAKYMRRMILDEGVRPDGRKVDEVRAIDVEHAFLPRTHGSSLFTRGETQAVAVCTLGGENMGQRFETLDGDGLRRFYLQYSFPPFSVGEVGRVGAPGRREVGHGKLAERALISTVPSLDDFPYTIRLESNITESNGSSSMASVCGGCLAMMDAGVPLKRPVSGIAMGLILEEGETAILSDILGLEDALGDMDFKVTGDEDGITAFQMDIKVEGITLDIMKEALEQARKGRVHILKKMLEVLPEPKEELSAYAPRIETIQIKQNKIAVVIGPGGKQIRKIIEETGVEINIDDSGLISIASSEPEAMKKAKAIIEGLTSEVEIGKTYDGKVTSVVQFGAFIEILPGKEGLCHISELAEGRVEDIHEHVKQGDRISVKVLDINERGQMKLSRKALLVKT